MEGTDPNPKPNQGKRYERPFNESLPHHGPTMTWWQWLLGHHPRSCWDRCYVLKVGGTQIPLCARCLGLYSAMVLGLGFGLALGWQVPAWTLGLALGLGFVDWLFTRIDYRPGSNPLRTATGALAGLALGWSVGARLPRSLSAEQWRVVTLLAVGAVMVELAALWSTPGCSGTSSESDDPPQSPNSSDMGDDSAPTAQAADGDDSAPTA